MSWHIRMTLVFKGTWKVTALNVFHLNMHKDGQGTEHGHALQRVCPRSVPVSNWYSYVSRRSFVAKDLEFEHVDSLIWIGHLCIHPWITHKAKVSMRRGDGNSLPDMSPHLGGIQKTAGPKVDFMDLCKAVWMQFLNLFLYFVHFKLNC